MKRIMGIVLMSALFGACNGSEQDKSASESESEVPAKLEKGKIRHTVMFRLKHDADAPETEHFLQHAQRALSGLPMVKNFEVLRQVSDKNPYTFYFSMVFDDQETYDAYNAHPEHVKFVKEHWATEVADFIEADFVAYE